MLGELTHTMEWNEWRELIEVIDVFRFFSYLFNSGLAAGVYTTNSAEAVFHVLESSNANIVVVDDTKQMDKIKEIKHRLPNLKAAIQLYGPYEPYVKREDGYYRVCTWRVTQKSSSRDLNLQYYCLDWFKVNVVIT